MDEARDASVTRCPHGVDRTRVYCPPCGPDPSDPPQDAPPDARGDSHLYDIARQVTDEVLGEGTYASLNAGHPDPGVQAAIRRSEMNQSPPPAEED